MSLEHIALIIAAPILVLVILWPPLLDFIGRPWRFSNTDVRKELPTSKSRMFRSAVVSTTENLGSNPHTNEGSGPAEGRF
jgi:hypothetical protein